MSNFEIIIELNKSIFSTNLYKPVVYFERDGEIFEDDIEFQDNLIIATGSRSSKIGQKGILETKKSTYYSLIVKGLLFVYFECKKSFEIDRIIVRIDNIETEEYEKGEITQVFSKDPSTEIENKRHSLDIKCSKMFSNNKKISDLMMISLMNLTLSYYDSNSSFDYVWKCFNALIREAFNKSRDFEMLKALWDDLEKSEDKYGNILSFASNIDIDYLRDCFLRDMINNEQKRKPDKLAELFEGFEDYRVCTVLQDLKDNKELIESERYSDITSSYEYSIDNMIEKSVDVVRLVVLKYAYYLRCAYFHAEEKPSNFLIKNKSSYELNRISYPLSLMCKDLLENKF